MNHKILRHHTISFYVSTGSLISYDKKVTVNVIVCFSDMCLCFEQLASAMKQQQTNEQVFNMWAWNVALKLHLHQSSFPSADIALANISGGVPVLANDNSLLTIVKGLKEKNSMASYMSLVISRFGHT